MPVVDLAARAARCLGVGLRQLTKALESTSFRKSAELKRHFYEECLYSGRKPLFTLFPAAAMTPCVTPKKGKGRNLLQISAVLV